MKAASTIKTICVVAVSTAIGYRLLWDDRLDYLGHYLGGFGGTLILFSLLSKRGAGRFRWNAVGIAYLAIAIGAVTEATIFRVAIFDPMDFFNQSLGAVAAAACIVERPISKPLGRGIAVVGSAVLLGGVFFALS